MTAIRQESEQLQANMHQFMRTIRALSPEQFRQSMNGWAPRDVVAHLIGWNRTAIEISGSILNDETPEALVDPGEDFCDVNAAFVKQYASTDMIELLRELELSYQELARYLYTIGEADWTHEVAVPGWDNPVSVAENIQAIAVDFADHAHEIEEWQRTLAPL